MVIILNTIKYEVQSSFRYNKNSEKQYDGVGGGGGGTF